MLKFVSKILWLRFKGDGSWLPQGWYLEDSTGVALLVQSVSPLFPHKQGLWYQRSLLLLQFFSWQQK